MTTTTTTFKIKDFYGSMDEDGRVVLHVSSQKPLPTAVTEGQGHITILDTKSGDVILAEVLDFNDAWYDGGEPTFVWVEFVGAWDGPKFHPADDPRHLTSDRF